MRGCARHSFRPPDEPQKARCRGHWGCTPSWAAYRARWCVLVYSSLPTRSLVCRKRSYGPQDPKSERSGDHAHHGSRMSSSGRGRTVLRCACQAAGAPPMASREHRHVRCRCSATGRVTAARNTHLRKEPSSAMFDALRTAVRRHRMPTGRCEAPGQGCEMSRRMASPHPR